MLENPTVQQLKIAFLSELLDELSDPKIINNAVLYSEQLKKSNAPAESTPIWETTHFADKDVQEIFSDQKQKIKKTMQEQGSELGDGAIIIHNKVRIDLRRLQAVFNLGGDKLKKLTLTCREQIILSSVLLNAAHEVVFPYFRQRAHSIRMEEASPLLSDDESSSSSADLSKQIIDPCQQEVTQSIFKAFPLGQGIFEPEPKLTVTERFKHYLRREILKAILQENGLSQTWENGTVMEGWIDDSANQLGDYYGPRIIDASFVAFSNTIAALTLFKSNSDAITSTLSPIWYYLHATCFLLMGIVQLSDARKHRRTIRKIKGLINIGNGTQLTTFTARAATYGGTALAAAFGTSFLHSTEEVYRCGMRIKNPNYWCEDTNSELEKLQEEIVRLTTIHVKSGCVSRFFAVNPVNRIIKLSRQKLKLEDYIDRYHSNQTQIPADALTECRKDFLKTLLDSAAQGVMFAAVTTNYAMPANEAPKILSLAFIALASVMLILKHMFSESLADNLVSGIWDHKPDDPPKAMPVNEGITFQGV